MKISHLRTWLACALVTLTAFAADDTDSLAGKWSVKKVNEQGQNYTQVIEVKRDKFSFQIQDADGRTVIYAEGDLKLDKLGSFKSARFFHLRGGSSASNLDDVDDEYNCIYTLDEDTWTLAVGFDKQRDQKPSMDLYRKVKTPEPRALVIDALEMADTPQNGTWFLCFEAKAEGVSGRYYVENKGFDKNQVTVPLALTLAKLQPGQKCRFTLRLDDVDGDACTEEADNRSTGEFVISDRGSQEFKPETNWRYTLRWHLQ